MNGDVEIYIRQKCPWSKLPPSIKQILAHSQKEYEKLVINLSIKNQLRFRGNLVRSVKKDERGYYEELLTYSREHLMLYPYHLSDFIVTGMRVTPFQYYISIMQDLMEQEKSYDSLPNFTAADCLRLLGIGRNEYIELMNQCRSSKKFFGVRRKPVRDLLPPKPVPALIIEPWWLVYVGYVTDEDIRAISEKEKVIIDKIIDDGAQKAGGLDLNHVIGLYRRGLIYLDVPIEDSDCVSVPPLEGFVMNRILGDYLETLLYKIFVSIDEHTNVAELANVLQVDLELVKNAVSMYCRLGFARKKVQDDTSYLHSSWEKTSECNILRDSIGNLDSYVNYLLCENEDEIEVTKTEDLTAQIPMSLVSVQPSKRIGFLFDSTLTAFLMMGNLSPGLKSHAVTMFEVGKLSDESLDSFLVELLKVADVGEGEARRYFDHALTLRDTILFLRQNHNLMSHYADDETDVDVKGFGLDLLRCESLQNLDQETCSRLLNKNYCLLISMAPLTYEIRPVSSCYPPHLGPPIPEVSSIWFKLYLYALTKSGPPSLLLAKGTRLRLLPKIFKDQKKLLVTTWAHDPSAVPMSNALPILNDALCHSAVLVQGQGSIAEFSYVPFPFPKSTKSSQISEQEILSLEEHHAIKSLQKEIGLEYSCGYITMMKVNNSAFLKIESNGGHHQILSTDTRSQSSSFFPEEKTVSGIQFPSFLNAFEEHPSPSASYLSCHKEENTVEKFDERQWTLLDCSFGIPLFDGDLNRKVCERLANAQLCNKMSLKYMVNSNRKLCLSLLEFISKHQPLISCLDSGRINSFSPHHPGSEFELPLPTANLMFFDGKLSIWTER